MTASTAALLADPERMRGVLEERLGYARCGLAVDRCRPLHKRYRMSDDDRRHGRPYLAVGYELAGGDDRQLVQLRAYRDGRSAEAFRLAGAQPLSPPRFGPALAHLPDLDAVVWSFPNDPRLPHLAEVADPVAVRRHLPRELAPVEDVEVTIVRYKPEVRLIARYRVLPADVVVFGKTFRHDGAGEVWRRMDAVRRALDGDADAYLVPRPLGFDAAVKTVWQAGLAGPPLVPLVVAGRDDGLLEAAARGLARLHAVELDGLATTTIGARLAAARAEAAELGELFPALAPRLDAIVARLERALPSLPGAPDGLVHGDFLLKQLVVDDGRLGIFDFDNFTRGDTIQDLANGIADFHYQGLDDGAVASLTTRFLDAYRATAERDVPVERLRWQLSVQWLRDAYYWNKRKHLLDGFEAELRRIIALAEDPPTPGSS